MKFPQDVLLPVAPGLDLITVAEATDIILSNARQPVAEAVALEDSVGRILKEDIRADEDFPRYDRVMTPGIAARRNAIEIGAELHISGKQLAGIPALELPAGDECIEVVAGAVLPHGAECVLPIEYIHFDMNHGQRRASITGLPDTIDPYVHPKGRERHKGDLLIPEFTRISPAEVAIAASVGKAYLRVARIPRIAIITTGNELVPVTTRPQPYQIRETNSYSLAVILKQSGADSDRFQLPDEPEAIRESLAEWTLTYDVLLLSGGAADLAHDHMPGILGEFGVKRLFNGVLQRPGKPFWVGSKTDAPHGTLMVFALPGNPVSSFVCAYRYFLPWLHKSFGQPEISTQYATLTTDVVEPSGFVHFLPVKLSPQQDGGMLAVPQKFQGPSDLAGLLAADAFIELPAEEDVFRAGDSFPVIRYR